MSQNFIIQFMGREGSSAIISALSAQKGVNVPLFEELDDYNFLQSHSLEDYPQVLGEIFKTQTHSIDPRKAEYLHTHPANAPIVTTGFKWRINGPLPAIAKVLNAYNVTVYSLQRRNFLSYACSLYIHKYGNRLQSDMTVPEHPHFEKEKGSKKGADAAQRLQLNQQEFPLDLRLFLKSAKESVKIRQNQTGISRRLARAGVPLRPIYYEDFDADNKGFITRILAEIGCDIGETYTPFCGFEKVHTRPLSERIIGLEKARNTWRFRHAEKEYHAAIKSLESLCAPQKKGSGEPLP
jgi:hypothetical protein